MTIYIQKKKREKKYEFVKERIKKITELSDETNVDHYVIT